MTEYLERFDHDPRSVGDPVEEKYRPGRVSLAKEEPQLTSVRPFCCANHDERGRLYDAHGGSDLPMQQRYRDTCTETANELAFFGSIHGYVRYGKQKLIADLSLDSPPTFVIPVEDLIGVYTACTVPPIQDDAIFLEGIELKANRLFGPQPRAETYLCLWEAVIPRITCSLSIPFIVTLQAVVSAVAYNFNDLDNAPAAIYQPAALPDGMSFMRASLTFSHFLQVMPRRGDHQGYEERRGTLCPTGSRSESRPKYLGDSLLRLNNRYRHPLSSCKRTSSRFCKS